MWLHPVPLSEQERLRAEPWGEGTRELTAADADAFAAFTTRAPEDDLDEAGVHPFVDGDDVDRQRDAESLPRGGRSPLVRGGNDGTGDAQAHARRLGAPPGQPDRSSAGGLCRRKTSTTQATVATR